MNQARAHAFVFLRENAAVQFIADCVGKLERRRSELAAGRARNAETDAYAARLHAEVAAEKARRAEENRARLAESDRQRADFRAELDRGMAEAKVEASLAFDRRVARKEVKRHAWLSLYWKKIAKARDDKDFQKKWIARESLQKTLSGDIQLVQVFRSAGDFGFCAAWMPSNSILIRQRWERVVELLDADPTLTSDEAEAVADPEYREQRADIADRDEARLAKHNAAQAG